MCHKDIHSRYLPRRDRALLGGETDADLDDAAAVSLVGDGVTFVVDLLERFLHGAVEFQLHDVDRGVGLQEDVHPAFCRAHLGIDIDIEEGEHHVEHSRKMALRCGCILQRALLIGDGGKESTRQGETLVYIVLSQGKIHLGGGIVGEVHIPGDVIRHEGTHQSHLHLLVGITEPVHVHHGIISLDGEVTALIEQWQDALHVLRGRVKLLRCRLTAIDLCEVGMKLLHHIDQERRCAGGEPIVVESSGTRRQSDTRNDNRHI